MNVTYKMERETVRQKQQKGAKHNTDFSKKKRGKVIAKGAEEIFRD